MHPPDVGDLNQPQCFVEWMCESAKGKSGRTKYAQVFSAGPEERQRPDHGEIFQVTIPQADRNRNQGQRLNGGQK